ncbi:MAG: polyketide synthase, partial [Polyangiaceae bacterium]
MTASPALGAPIAIVGTACRFPGEIESPDDLWEFLRQGRDAITGVPSARWVDAGDERATSRRCGGFLGDVEGFEASFFRVSPTAAASVDPQHRVLLEVAASALEDAGLVLEGARSKQGGVFVGISNSDFAFLRQRARSHVGLNDAPGFVAYNLDLRGPTLAVDAACASSLVATCLACDSLRRQECDFALAAGVNLVLMPERIDHAQRAGHFSHAGHCRSFDSRADGYVLSDGVGVIVLKLLSRAIADGDFVIATILGGAVNN